MQDLDTSKVILVDCDGVLTDGRLHIDHKGEKMFKAFHTRDVRAIRELIFHGYEVVLVSADDWKGIYHFADKVGALVHISREKGKLPYENFIAVGDDAWDIPMLVKARIAFAPRDADLAVLEIPNIRVVGCDGGSGVMALILQMLYKEHLL